MSVSVRQLFTDDATDCAAWAVLRRRTQLEGWQRLIVGMIDRARQDLLDGACTLEEWRTAYDWFFNSARDRDPWSFAVCCAAFGVDLVYARQRLWLMHQRRSRVALSRATGVGRKSYGRARIVGVTGAMSDRGQPSAS